MDLQAGAAWATALAGFLVIGFGFLLGWKDLQLRSQVSKELREAPKPDPDQGVLPGGVDPAEYLKQLAELAKAVAGLPQASQAFFIGTLLLAFTTAIAIFDKVVA